MRKIKDVLRLKLDAKLSHGQIAGSLSLSKGVVAKYAGLAAAAGLTWPEVQACDDITLERRLLAARQRPPPTRGQARARTFSRTMGASIRNCAVKV